ncbi:hypothetical protein [Yinghuangia sp. YIM S09857]|uniref:hypothetical protein n=1 Tax=Yinghuangia sp. YIM S09857 TaxID=3436929 RepID=UPI003F537766
MPVRRIRNRIDNAGPAPARGNSVAAVGAGALVLALLLGACGEDDPRDKAEAAGPAVSSADAVSPGPDTPVAPDSARPSPPQADLPVPSTAPDTPAPPAGPLTPEDRVRLAREAAARAAEAWEQARATAPSGPSFILTQSGIDQTGNWEADKGAYKAAFGNACFDMRPTATVPRHPAEAEIRRADGTVFTRPFVGPDKAFARSVPDAIRAGCGSPHVPFLPVTGVALTTGTVATSDGQATVPMWELTFEGTAVRGRATAVLSDPVPPRLPMPGAGPSVGAPNGKATVSPDGRTVTVGFIGSPDVPGPCGADYAIEAVQRADVVALAVVAHARGPQEGMVCTAIGATRTASVTLDAPLGSRALIDAHGQPIARG